MLKFFRLPFASSGDKVTIPDTPPTDGSINYTTGFDADYEADPVTNPATYKDIPRTGVNQALFDITNAIKELQSDIPAWISSTLNGGTDYPYEIGTVVRYTDGGMYQSLSASNIALPTDTAHWQPVDFASMTTHINNLIAAYVPAQSLQDVTASRAGATVYQNLTPNTIKVWVICAVGSGQTAIAHVDTVNPPTLALVNFGNAGGGTAAETLYFDVAPNEYYEIVMSGASITQWVERR